jgi:hypothetical protein
MSYGEISHTLGSLPLACPLAVLLYPYIGWYIAGRGWKRTLEYVTD